MKLSRQMLLILLSLGTAMTGCEKEIIEPVSSQPVISLASNQGFQRPDQQCGSSRTGYLLDGDGNQIGNVEVLNGESSLYLLISMNQGFFLESAFANFGTTGDLPVSPDGELNFEEFMYQSIVPGGKTNYSIIVQHQNLPVCNDIVLMGQVSEKNIFGQTIANHQVWLGNSPIYNGYFFKYCIQNCN